MTPPASSPARAALRLENATILLAALEAVGALLSGWLAASVALVAFGADSVVEMLSAVVVLGQLRVVARGAARDRRSEHRAHRLLAILFFLLALYVVSGASWALWGHRVARENALGLIVTVASAVAMPALAGLKRSNSRLLASHHLASLARLMAADAAETALCAVLALSTLLGVVLAWIHWWWADPLASLLVVYFALREGREAWRCD
ncbi:MAG: cation transporter [Acidobacteria bacterium]|nr:cation transporter [Acidobacteriota bacterium]